MADNGRFRGPQRLEWKGNALHLDGKGKPVVRIVPDVRWPGMWRVEPPDGRLTDMANRAWTNAALTIACRLLNQRDDKAA